MAILELGSEELHDDGEFRRNQILRASLGELLVGIPTIYLDRKVKDIVNVYSVDGYYDFENEDGVKFTQRQMREYRANSFGDASEQARDEGLTRGIIVEALLTPPSMGFSFKGVVLSHEYLSPMSEQDKEERCKKVEEHETYLNTRYSELV